MIVGVDGGGTETRVLCADTSGALLSHASGAGANWNHNREATENVRAVIALALRRAGATSGDVACLVAGLAGLDRDEDLARARELTNVADLSATRIHLNDAEIAWAGAFSLAPGVIVACGTGSIVWARTDTGRVLRNYDFNHYARSAARHLAYHTLFSLLSADSVAEEARLCAALCAHFGVASLGALRELAARNTDSPSPELNRQYGAFAPVITRAAEQGSALAQRVCERAVDDMITGFLMVSGGFREPSTSVALIGSVARSSFIARTFAHRLAHLRARHTLVAPALSPVAGAVLIGLRELGVGALAEARLAEEPRARFGAVLTEVASASAAASAE